MQTQTARMSPQEMIKNITDSYAVIDQSKDKTDAKVIKASEEISKMLASMREIMFSTDEQAHQTELTAQIAQEMHNQDIPLLFVNIISYLDNEGKRDLTEVFAVVLRRQVGTRSPTVEYICSKSEILFMLLKGYESPAIASESGVMLRECSKHEPLAKILLESHEFYNLFTYMESSTSEIASDSFLTFKELITRHKILGSHFLERNYDKFFVAYYKFMDCDNNDRHTRALKFLSDLLLDRHNYNVMKRFIDNPENLVFIMNVMSKDDCNVQFAAFHVFKIFVADPNKTKSVLDLLFEHRDSLIKYLNNFQTDRTEDKQFNDEKAFIIKQIAQLSPQ